MKSRNLKLGLFCISLLLFWACEDVIDLDLNESEPQITIEAQLQGGSHTFNVLISKSTPFFEPGTEEKVNNAVVTLIDDQGNDTDIPLVRDGEYSEHITAFVGRQYTLRVEIDGEVYEATSNLLQPVGLVDIEAKFQSAGFIEEDDGYEVIFYYEDPVGMDNYYRARFYINDVPQFEGEFLQVLDDSFSDGETARSPILTEIFQEGQNVTVELMHFDKAAHDYFKALTDILGEGGGIGAGIAAPGNPPSNWSGNILGHFTAFSSDTISIDIQ